jgi:hypothetical protein
MLYFFLQNLVKLCANRVVLFDNKTKDEVHKKEQLKKLLCAVDSVISNTDGIFSNQMFSQIKVINFYWAFWIFFLSVLNCILRSIAAGSA